MSVQPLLLPLVPPSSAGRVVRVEYLDFQNVAENREFRFRVYGPGESTGFRVRIALAAFGAGRVKLQDGPDVCYQRLLRALAAGATPSPEVIAIDDGDLASYREAHTHVPKRRPRTPWSPPTPVIVPQRQPRTPAPKPAVAPLVVNDGEPALEAGQRVSHSVFGAGVTTAADSRHTAVRFDRDGPKTFVTPLLKVDVLSAPHTWETGPRGVNRPCPTLAPRADTEKAR